MPHAPRFSKAEFQSRFTALLNRLPPSKLLAMAEDDHLPIA